MARNVPYPNESMGFYANTPSSIGVLFSAWRNSRTVCSPQRSGRTRPDALLACDNVLNISDETIPTRDSTFIQ